MKKWLLSLIALAMIVTTVPTGGSIANAEEIPESENLSDYLAVDSLDHWATDVLTDFMQADVLKGYDEDGWKVIMPEGKITRAEFIAILLRAADVKTQSGDSKFNDMKKEDWFYDTVVTASNMGIIYGKETSKFAPNDQITRAEISAILYRYFAQTISFDGAAVQFNDVSNHWAKPEIEKISQAGIIVGYLGNFEPNHDATRAEASSMIYRSLHKEAKQLPEASLLIEKASQLDLQQKQMLLSPDFDQLDKFFTEKTIGFVRILGLYSIETYKALIAEGVEITADYKGEAKYEVIYSSDRYAAVKRTGLEVETTLTDGESSASMKVNPEATYLLRKTDGLWKVYGAVEDYEAWANSFFEEEEEN